MYYVEEKGKRGIFYKKDDGVVTYYLETIDDDGGRLFNKQMIKVGRGEIPNIKGLANAINKKIAVSVPSDAASAVPQLYVQDVRNNYSNNSIVENTKNNNGNNLSENSDGQR